MLVSMWMARNLVTVGQELMLSDVAALMSRHRIRRVPVVEPAADGPRLLGIVSAADILPAFPHDLNPFSASADAACAEGEHQSGADKPITVMDVMTRNPLTCTADAPIETAARLMCENKIGALPVVRKQTLVGLITESDIFRAFTDIFDSTAVGARITFALPPDDDEDIFPLVTGMACRHRLRVVNFISLTKHEHPVCVIEVAGTAVDALLEEIWKSKHQVISVLHLP
ncbi:MAG: CBS domain-containing protein [Pseudomonadales bacterium]|nr:CBS domain-containing protein [Pseudomonadales bacterium]